jgi:hypothetical protein
MSAVDQHLKRYPNARGSTLAHVEKRGEMTKRLREEIGMDAVTDKRAKFIAECETKETVLQRLIRKLRRK